MRVDQATPSTQLLRRMNAQAVLRFAVGHSVFNASNVIEATGLTRSTVIGLCDYLIELGWIHQPEDARADPEYSKGRPARRFALRSDAGFVIGVDAGEHSITAAVANLRGEVLGRVRRSYGDQRFDSAVRLSVTCDAIDTVLADCAVPIEKVLASVFGIPSPTDSDGHSPVGQDGYWASMNPGLSDAFVTYGRVVVENDANLAAIAEQSVGIGQGTRSFAALLSGERFGAGLIMDGVLIRGQHGGAGEMRVLDLVDGVGSATGLAALARDWAQESKLTDAGGAASPMAELPRVDVTAESVLTAARNGDETSLAIVDRLGDRLARVCFVLASLLDVERVILVGAIAVAAGPIIDRARTVLAENFYAPIPEIAASELGADAVVLGAIQRGLALVQADPLGLVLVGLPLTATESVNL
ncbi:ROK family protein [Cryobacterium sp. PH31-O1]|uniref:ROK family protein n=1 Tax=Cryobacterium sp. PH31-O1 TaxID=3046306 RepID=UPI0024B96DA1|nr:ROK family protein [Cryobacterium sp. PH31-O1]MDJ0339619.1 ROK family protein [Cryobacterium sp. PH31-O1]